MSLHRLSARKVATASEGKYEDSKGLRLVVSSTGAKKWVFRFTFNGKQREMGLGSFPTVSLERARILAQEARVKIFDGIDPIQSREVQRQRYQPFKPMHLSISN